MAQTYKQIQKQIEQLQRKADSLRDGEIKGVIERIKVAIAHYGLTAAHLGLGSASAGRKASGAKSGAKSRANAKVAQFSDGAGNEWSGRGPRPRWLREALATGRSLEEFRIAGSTPSAAAPAAKTRATKAVKKTKRAPSKVNYTDGEGHSWTGRGPMPKWLKTAIEGGKTLQDFAQ